LIPLGVAIGTAALLLSTAASAQAMVVFNSHWGGAGVIAHWHHDDLCQLERLSPGSHKLVIVHSLGFDHIVSHGGQYRYGTLMCAAIRRLGTHNGSVGERRMDLAAMPGRRAPDQRRRRIHHA
jgi:hypothetical protein